MSLPRRFLASLKKENTGKLLVRSTAVIDAKEAEKLHFIFQGFAGQTQDSAFYFDEFSQEKVRLSRISFDLHPINPVEENILKKFHLQETGLMTPLDLIEEFEAQMGAILKDEDGELVLEGSWETFGEAD